MFHRKREAEGDLPYRRGVSMATKAEIGVMPPKPRKANGHQKLEEARERFLLSTSTVDVALPGL